MYWVKNILEIIKCWYWYFREDKKRNKIARDRLKTCITCVYLVKGCINNKVFQYFFKKAWRCKLCGCYIYAKIYSEKLKCEKGYWDE